MGEQARRVRSVRMRRHPGGRRHAVKVLLSDEERARVRARAVAVGVSVPRLLVESALAGDVQTVSERRGLLEEFLAARQLVARVSNNLNQLTRAVHATGELQPQLEAALRATVRTVERLERAAGKLQRR